ncbi:MAG: hypothetical protein KF889_07900 [Alphaproteobacteria bacterium]|nr:hypothetical protein [Alphaproteobacteria bacterium]MCW5740742.1 hypothetical protein [Alphaproteobacteria bacterium]
MIKRSFTSIILASGIVLSGVLAAPAFAQSYGAMPRGACPKSASASYVPKVHVQHQTAYEAAYSAPVRETRRPRRSRGFGSPF